MNYEQFLVRLREDGWSVPNRSFAYRTLKDWQVAFIRMGGRYQIPEHVGFVICVRHKSLRNVNMEKNEVEKEPSAYPFKLTLKEVEGGRFRYQSKLLNFDVTQLPAASEWERVLNAMERTIPVWMSGLTPGSLSAEISDLGEAGYIERLWLEDLK